MQPFEQLAVIWFGVLIAAFLAKRTSLTPVLYFLAVGAVFDNVGLLPEEPAEFVRGFAEFGIVLIMFAIGFEERIEHFMESVAISMVSALAMTATAVSLTMMVLKSEGLGQSDVATRVMTSAVLDDIAALALVAVIVPIAAGGGFPGTTDLLLILLKVVGFFVIVTLLGGWLFPLISRNGQTWNLKSLLAFEGGTTQPSY